MSKVRHADESTCALPTWDDRDAIIDSQVSARRFQLRHDAFGAVRVLCRDGEAVREVTLVELINEARGSAALLRARSAQEDVAAAAAWLRQALGKLLRSLAVRMARLRAARHPAPRTTRAW